MHSCRVPEDAAAGVMERIPVSEEATGALLADSAKPSVVLWECGGVSLWVTFLSRVSFRVPNQTLNSTQITVMLCDS